MKRIITEICLFLTLFYYVFFVYAIRTEKNMHVNLTKPFADHSGYHIVISHELGEITK